MNEEIVKTEEAVKETVSKTEQLMQQIRAGEGGSVWREIWNTYQGSLIHIGKVILLAILVLIITYFICKAVRGLIGKLSSKYSIDISIAGIIKRTVTVVIYSFAVLIILDLLGINTASVLTVLGAAGLAVGLALKDTLSNIAAGIFLLTQHPYKTGDFVECAGMSGSILTIGLFTTKLRTPQGQDIFVPNNSIITSPITNYSSNKTRRADITVGISYGDNLEEGIKILQQLLDSNPLILKDPAPAIYVSDLADSSVNLTLRYWTDNDKYWDAYWAVKRALKSTIEGAGLNIPFPQRVITMANTD